MTPKEIFDVLPSQLDPNAAKGLAAIIQFNLTGDEGGKWYVTVKNGTATVSTGTASNPSMTMLMSADDYVAMLTGGLNGQVAFMSGRLKISGDMELANKLRTLFRRLTV